LKRGDKYHHHNVTNTAATTILPFHIPADNNLNDIVSDPSSATKRANGKNTRKNVNTHKNTNAILLARGKRPKRLIAVFNTADAFCVIASCV
jgi:hypothetical protein